MVEFLGPGGEFLLIRFDGGVERVGRGGGGVVAARLERAPCPHRLIPDGGDASVDELMDRVRRGGGGVLLVRRERRLARGAGAGWGG